VNLAARLESLAEPVRTLASEETVRHGRNDFVVTGVGPIEVKGVGRVLVHVIEDESGLGKAGR
jgi:class 3 adenylate cyclase